jgi:putative hydrolases of HD superfamily
MNLPNLPNLQITNLMNFIEFTNLFATIKRDIYKNQTDKQENENDAEHTFQLAMVSWYVVDTYNINCDKNLLIKFALVHDLVEAYAGDISAWDIEGRKNKQEQEEIAFHKVKDKFSHFPEMIELISKYEDQNDKEAVLVNAIDKLLPCLNIIIENGVYWQDKKKGLEELIAIKETKIKKSTDIYPIWEEVKQYLIKNEAFYFTKKSN